MNIGDTVIVKNDDDCGHAAGTEGTVTDVYPRLNMVGVLAGGANYLHNINNVSKKEVSNDPS